MNFHKLVAILLAILVNCAIAIGLLAWAADAATSAQSRQVPGDAVTTLAPVNVYPSAAELQALHAAHSDDR